MCVSNMEEITSKLSELTIVVGSAQSVETLESTIQKLQELATQWKAVGNDVSNAVAPVKKRKIKKAVVAEGDVAVPILVPTVPIVAVDVPVKKRGRPKKVADPVPPVAALPPVAIENAVQMVEEKPLIVENKMEEDASVLVKSGAQPTSVLHQCDARKGMCIDVNKYKPIQCDKKAKFRVGNEDDGYLYMCAGCHKNYSSRLDRSSFLWNGFFDDDSLPSIFVKPA